VIGGHVFGHIYTAVIGTVITPFHHGWDAAAVPQEACLLCRACFDACPSKIDLPRMVLAVRDRLEERQPTKGIRAFFLNHILPNPPLLRLALGLLALAQTPFVQDKRIRKLPGPLSRLTGTRTLPALPSRRLRDRLGAKTAAQGERKTTAVFFGSCLLDFVYPEIGQAVVKVLTHHGVEVRFPKAQSCCGLPPYYEGHHEAAKRMARQLVEVLDAEPADYIVTATPPCGITIRQYLPKLLRGDPLEAKAKAMAEKCFEFSELLLKVLPLGDARPHRQEGERTLLTYHDSCSGFRGLKIYDAPRRLLKTLRRYKFREMDEIGECCGFGGHFTFDYPDVAGHVLDRKLAAVERTGAKVLALDSPGCLLQIRGGLEKRGSPIQVKHIAELLAEEL
jgi:Fe-S oxidoreductase